MTRTAWNLAHMSESDAEFCEKEARKLAAQYIKDDAGTPISYEDWLECITDSVMAENEHHNGMLCGEIGEY